MTRYTAPMPPSAAYPASPHQDDTYYDSHAEVEYTYGSGGWSAAASEERDVDWFGERHGEQYLFRRVSWEAWQQEISTGYAVPDEIGELTNITGGNVSLSALSDMKATCEFEYEGGEPPNPNELVRIYYTFEDGRGRKLDSSASNQRNRPAVLGTFFPVYTDVGYEEDDTSGERTLKKSGTVRGESVLSVLLNRKMGMPYTIPAGTPTLQFVDQTVKSLGLRTNNPPYVEQGQSSASVTKNAHTFEPDDPLITVLNWCLRNTTPRYRALFPDPYGIVQIQKYVDVEGEPPQDSIIQKFTTDEFSIVQRGIVSDNDWQTTPNVCRISYTDENVSIYAVSKNLTGSRFSLDARGGREITVQGDVEELGGNTNQQMLDSLKSRCEFQLKENSSEIEHTVFRHAYLGWLLPNDAVALEYVDTWTGYITNMDVSLSPSTQCQTKIRKFLSNSITYLTEGGILWTA